MYDVRITLVALAALEVDLALIFKSKDMSSKQKQLLTSFLKSKWKIYLAAYTGTILHRSKTEIK